MCFSMSKGTGRYLRAISIRYLIVDTNDSNLASISLMLTKLAGFFFFQDFSFALEKKHHLIGTPSNSEIKNQFHGTPYIIRIMTLLNTE